MALLALIREHVAAIYQWLEQSKGSPLSISVFDAGNCPREICNLVLDTIIHSHVVGTVRYPIPTLAI